MDSLSQIVLGGAVGEAVLGKKVGNKAILWGAIGGTIPDLDTIPGQFLDTVSRLDIHRGFSHSIVFAILISPILGWLIHRIYKKKQETGIWEWTQLFFWSIITHPLLDIFTTWGTQLFWPLDWRISLDSIFVIDPLYTLPFLLCLIVVLLLKRKNPIRKKINQFGLIYSSVYLFVALGIKMHVDKVFKSNLEKQGIKYLGIHTRPAPFNTILWSANIELEDRFLIAYYSLLDKNQDIYYSSFKKQHDLLQAYRNDPQIERLLFLSKGMYTIEKEGSGIVMNDLRFGLTEGFDQGKGDFVFAYTIEANNGEIIIDQKPNSFDGIDKVMGKLWLRIKGVKTF